MAAAAAVVVEAVVVAARGHEDDVDDEEDCGMLRYVAVIWYLMKRDMLQGIARVLSMLMW